MKTIIRIIAAFFLLLCYAGARAQLTTVNEYYNVAENAATNLFVLQNDTYDTASAGYPVITAVTQPKHGTSTHGYNNVTYFGTGNYTGVDSFTYTACLGDSLNGVGSTCGTATVYLQVVDSIYVSISQSQATCPGNCDGRLDLSVTGGVTPYTITWSNGSSASSLPGLCTDSSFSVTVTDANFVSAITSATITAGVPPLNMVVDADTIYLQAYNFGDTANWVFTWSNGVIDSSVQFENLIISQSGYYCVTATNSQYSCIFTSCDSIGCVGCVWPGDANDDGIVDNNDLLPIGLAYGATGPVRANASLNWVGQTSPDWTDTLLTGTNYKFIDCNGDGTINADDTLAVQQNFGQIHLKSGVQHVWRSGAPALTVNLSADTLVNGQTVTATFSLGSADLPANNVYGIAFTFNCDPNVITPGSVQGSFGDSWMATSGNKISLAKNVSGSGQIECALTRIDHTPVSGYGPIGMATFVITTDNINGLSLGYYNLDTWISDLTMIDNLGNQLQVNEGGDTAIVQYTPAGIKETNIDAEISVFPNPAHEQLIIQSQNQLPMQEITLINLLGETVITQAITQPYQTTINVSSLSSGAYFVQVKTASRNGDEAVCSGKVIFNHYPVRCHRFMRWHCYLQVIIPQASKSIDHLIPLSMVICCISILLLLLSLPVLSSLMARMPRWWFYHRVYRNLPGKKFYLSGTGKYKMVYTHRKHEPDDGFMWFVYDDTVKLSGDVYIHNNSLTYHDRYSPYWHHKYINWLKKNVDLDKLEKFEALQEEIKKISIKKLPV